MSSDDSCENPPGSCFICHQPSSDSCRKSNHDETVYFCSKEHERLHSGDKTSSCFPYRVTKSHQVGRFLVASRKILRGEIIFQELPGIVGPNPVVSSPICVACYKQVGPRSSCPKCGFPLCEESCERDHGFICEHLHRFGIDLTPEEMCDSSILHAILPLKLLLSKESNPHVYNCLSILMDHREDRLNDPEYLEGIQTPILKSLERSLSTYSTDELLKALGIVEVNSYEVYNLTGHSGFRGLFCLTSLLSHDCVPKRRPIIGHETPYGLTMISTRNINEGEILSINYVHTQKPNRIRRRTLKDNWYFECSCKRCEDEAEFGLHPDAIWCDSCQEGLIKPSHKGIYCCDKCSREKSQGCIEDLIESLESQKAEIDRQDVNQYLELYRRSSVLLGENHYFLNSPRRWIIPLFCRPLTSSPRLVPSPDMLRDKIQLCEGYLRLLNKIEPGLSKNRGKVLYEWAECSLKLLNVRGGGDKDLLVSIRSALKESLACLEHEQHPSFEYTLGKAASKTLILVNEFIGNH
uniref:Msta, isoform A n=1 Tax=Caligus clemensi TaxID=344056 RepID=C1C083_CALCM|nr:msta, isoform A [Caligus clemensi]